MVPILWCLFYLIRNRFYTLIHPLRWWTWVRLTYNFQIQPNVSFVGLWQVQPFAIGRCSLPHQNGRRSSCKLRVKNIFVWRLYVEALIRWGVEALRGLRNFVILSVVYGVEGSTSQSIIINVRLLDPLFAFGSTKPLLIISLRYSRLRSGWQRRHEKEPKSGYIKLDSLLSTFQRINVS